MLGGKLASSEMKMNKVQDLKKGAAGFFHNPLMRVAKFR